MSTIEQRLDAIEKELGMKNDLETFTTDEILSLFNMQKKLEALMGYDAKDPYAEAKQAWKDGCLQLYTNGVTKWRDWPHDTPPVWENLHPTCFRRKPDAKDSTTNTLCIMHLQHHEAKCIHDWLNLYTNVKASMDNGVLELSCTKER